MGDREGRIYQRRRLIGKRLRGIRVMQNKSLETVAGLLGKDSKATVSNYETALRAIDLDTLAEYCKLLNISADYILGIVDDMRPIFGSKHTVLDETVNPEELSPEIKRVLTSLSKLIIKAQEEEKRETSPKGGRKKK